jgi:hypothetical protein
MSMLKSIETLPFWILPTAISEMVKINTRDIRRSKYALIAVEKSLSIQDNRKQETNLAIGQSLVAQANSKDNNWRKRNDIRN